MSQPQDSLEIARRLIARQATGNARESREVSAALQRTCSRVLASLRDALGDDGTTALLARALRRTEEHHPSLKSVRRLDGMSIHLDGVPAAVEEHGVAHVSAAVEALLAALVDILGRLIGEDMAMRILDLGMPAPSTNGKAPSP